MSVSGWLEERLPMARLREKLLRKAFPVHHSFFLGEITLVAFATLVATGFFLTMLYEPSSRLIKGAAGSVPAAYASVVNIDALPFGRVLRSVHHWSAHIMIAAAILHLIRIFTTGAYQKPREVNWLVGLALLLFTVMAAFTGFSLPFDAFAVTATRIGYGIAASIPWVGSWMAQVFFGGRYPTSYSIPRLLPIHILWIPLLIAALIGMHLLVIFQQKHTQPQSSRQIAPGQVLGVPLVPQQLAMSVILLFIYWGVLFTLAGTFPAHPVEAFGPPTEVTPAVRPDWYFLWVYGVLQLIPSSWHCHLPGTEVTPEFLGGVMLPTVIGLAAVSVPFIDRRSRPLRYADRPTHHPGRSGVAAGALTFFAIACVSGFHSELGLPIVLLRLLLMLAPLTVGLVIRLAFGRLAAGKRAIIAHAGGG